MRRIFTGSIVEAFTFCIVVWGGSVASAQLIQTVDYSDTFTVAEQGGVPERTDGSFGQGSPAYDVEDSHGNPVSTWTPFDHYSFNTGLASTCCGYPTNDGNTGANSSRWSTWWAALAPPNVTIDVGPSQNEGNSGNSTFAFTARLSYAYGLPVKVFFHTSDGSATVANNDYQSLNSTVIIPAGATTIPINITVKGDTSCETDETFSVTLTSASDNIPLGATVTATGTILNDETYTITATAGAGGTITPSGSVVVSCNTNQSFTIAPDLCHVIQDVVVDGASQGAQTSYTFNSVSAAHTITASFLPNMTLGETHTHVSCNGVTDGAIDLTVTGGTGGLTYAWSNGASTQDISGLAAGSYSVTVTDANSCTATLLNVSITQPAVLALSETHVDVTTCGGTNGSIDLSVAGGTGPYGYAWSNGATTQDLSGLATGSYTFNPFVWPPAILRPFAQACAR